MDGVNFKPLCCWRFVHSVHGLWARIRWLMKEFALIAQLTQCLKAGSLPHEIGAGDDCAAFTQGQQTLLFTCDAAVEGQHFISELTPWSAIGWRLATANVSDVYACGGQPLAALISVSTPKHLATHCLQQVYNGLQDAATHYGFSILGGNVSEAEHLQLHMSMLGCTTQFIARGQAKVGDWIAVSGPLGGAEAGRLLWRQRTPQGKHTQTPPNGIGLETFHLKPMAPTQLARALTSLAHAAIDISDGLGSELHHLAQASQVAMHVHSVNIPKPKGLEVWCKAQNQPLTPWVLGAGEEYQLLITGGMEQRQQAIHRGFVMIGEVKAGQGVWVDNQPLSRPLGWQHL